MSYLSSPDHATLIAIIRDLSLEMATKPTFRIGRQYTNFNLQLGSALNHPLAAKLIGRGMLALLYESSGLSPIQRIGAVGIRGIAVTTAMLVESSHTSGAQPHAFVVERGAVQGLPVNRGIHRGSISHKQVVLVEDVATNGHATLRAAEAVGDAGGYVAAILAVVNRGNQAAGMYKRHGLAFHALLNATTDILPPGFTPLTRWPSRRPK